MSILPSTTLHNKCIFVVIRNFSKVAIMAPYKKSITAEATAKLFFELGWYSLGSHIPLSQIEKVGS